MDAIVRSVDLPGLFDVDVVEPDGCVIEELRDLTLGQVNDVARRRGLSLRLDERTTSIRVFAIAGGSIHLLAAEQDG